MLTFLPLICKNNITLLQIKSTMDVLDKNEMKGLYIAMDKCRVYTPLQIFCWSNCEREMQTIIHATLLSFF